MRLLSRPEGRSPLRLCSYGGDNTTWDVKQTDRGYMSEEGFLVYGALSVGGVDI